MPRRTEIRCAGRHLGFIAVFNKVLFWHLELCFLSFIDKFEKTIVCSTTLHRKKIDIYANISLFLYYSEVTVATISSPYPAQMVTAVTRIRSVSRSDGHCSHPDPVRIQIRWSLQSPRSGPYPDQMVTAVTRIQSVSRSDGGSAPRDDFYSPERQRRSEDLVT